MPRLFIRLKDTDHLVSIEGDDYERVLEAGDRVPVRRRPLPTIRLDSPTAVLANAEA